MSTRRWIHHVLPPFATAVGVAVSGFAAAILLMILTVTALDAFGIGFRDDLVITITVGVVVQGAAFGIVAFTYLHLKSLGIDFLRIRWPSLKDILWMVAGLVGLFAALITMSIAITLAGLPTPAEHVIGEIGAETPELLLVLVPLSFLVIGPGEELLFRGVIQTRLVQAYGDYWGIIVTSIIFAVAHLTAFEGGNITISIGVLFVLSLILGAIYEITDNLVVPAVIHGAYNAILFLGLYAQLTMNGELTTLLTLTAILP